MAGMAYKLSPEIILGHDSLSRAGTLCAPLGNRALVVAEHALHEANSIERLTSVLKNSGIEAILFDELSAQSTAEAAGRAAALARGACCNVVIGFGGLRTQAVAKMASMAAFSRLDIFDFLDDSISEDPFLPYIAIPSDLDPFMFSHHFMAPDPRDRSVKLLKSPQELCKAVIIDQGLFTAFLSGKFASTAAFDGFCTAVESYCSTRSNFFSDALLEQAITFYSGMIKNQTQDNSPDLTEGIVNAAFLVAMSDTVSAPGIGTALAYALDSKFSVAKSWCSTVILPYILEKLAIARPGKMARIAALMGEPVEGCSIGEAAAMVTEAIRHYIGILQVPARLKEFNLSLDRLGPVAEDARNLEFVAYSPWTVASENAFDILRQAY